MKFFVSIILMALLSFAACLYLPWWSVAAVAFIVILLIPLRPGVAFLAGFIALFLLWAGLSTWISTNNDNILAQKMSIIILGIDNPVLLIVVTGLIGGIVAGLASLAAGFLRAKKVNKVHEPSHALE